MRGIPYFSSSIILGNSNECDGSRITNALPDLNDGFRKMSPLFVLAPGEVERKMRDSLRPAVYDASAR